MSHPVSPHHAKVFRTQIPVLTLHAAPQRQNIEKSDFYPLQKVFYP